MAAKKKSLVKRKPVPRHARKYLFRNDHPVDQHVEGILNYWRSGKQEITNLRKAVALYYALEQGDLPALFDAFPQYKTQFAPSTAEALEQFMQILKQQQVVQAPEPAAGSKQIAAPSFAMPVFEDDDQPTLIFKKVTETENGSSLNFINMSKQLIKK
ncbi:MAG: hypothetical protein H0X30_00105 [Anaerolineae bacterium]|nr:hypothetical protein [Anaerolineae bacterium]